MLRVFNAGDRPVRPSEATSIPTIRRYLRYVRSHNLFQKLINECERRRFLYRIPIGLLIPRRYRTSVNVEALVKAALDNYRFEVLGESPDYHCPETLDLFGGSD